MFKLALVTFSALVLVSLADPTVDDVVPEVMHNAPASMNSFLETTKDKSDDEVMQMVQALLRKEPESIMALNEAIETIIADVIASHQASQKLINEEVDAFATCAAMPLVDKDANQNAANKFLLIEPAQKEQDNVSTGEIDYDFGEDETQSAIAAAGVKTAIDAYKKVFDDAYNRRETAQGNYDAAQTSSDNADKAATAASNQCHCAARTAYDNVVAAAMESNKNDKANLKHFQMIQCVMTEFAKDTKEEGAFDTCKGKTFDDKVVEIDFRASDAKLPSAVADACGSSES